MKQLTSRTRVLAGEVTAPYPVKIRATFAETERYLLLY